MVLLGLVTYSVIGDATALQGNEMEGGMHEAAEDITEDASEMEFVPGEILVKVKYASISMRIKNALLARTLGSDALSLDSFLQQKGSFERKQLFPSAADRGISAPSFFRIPAQKKDHGIDRIVKLRSSRSDMTKEETLDLIRELNALPDVEYAEPNYIVHIIQEEEKKEESPETPPESTPPPVAVEPKVEENENQNSLAGESEEKEPEWEKEEGTENKEPIAEDKKEEGLDTEPAKDSHGS